MPLLKYVGPHDEVYVRDAGVHVKRGESADIPEPVAASLLEQETFVAAEKTQAPARTAQTAKTED
jgi:hypothetical protein